jgi:hypothetical protein
VCERERVWACQVRGDGEGCTRVMMGCKMYDVIQIDAIILYGMGLGYCGVVVT